MEIKKGHCLSSWARTPDLALGEKAVVLVSGKTPFQTSPDLFGVEA